MIIVVVGAGGVGGTLGVRLTEAGHEVAYLVRGENLAALRKTGIALASPLGNVSLGPQRASDNAADLGAADLGAADAVIVTTKLYDLEALAPRLAPLIGADTALLPLQNGVEAHGILARALAPFVPLKGTVAIKASLRAPGAIECKSDFCRIRMGEVDNRSSPRLERLAQALKRCIGVDAVVSPDIEGDLWKKFVMLASFSAVGCMARATIGQMLASPEARERAHDGTSEAAAVGRALGVNLSEDIADVILKQIAGMPPDGKPSMLEDLEAGRRLELPWLSGAVVRLGKEAGVPTPLHAAACAALAKYVDGARSGASAP